MGYYIFIGFYILVFSIVVGLLVGLIATYVKQEKQERERAKERKRKREKERAGFKEWLEKANKAEKHNAIVEAKGTIPDPWILYNENFKKFLDLSKTKYEIDYRYVINNFEKTLEKEQVIIILEDYEVVVAAFDKWLNLKAEKEMEEFQKKVDRKLQFIKLNEVKHGTTT